MGTVVETQNEIEQLMDNTRESVGLLLNRASSIHNGDYEKIISAFEIE